MGTQMIRRKPEKGNFQAKKKQKSLTWSYILYKQTGIRKTTAENT